MVKIKASQWAYLVASIGVCFLLAGCEPEPLLGLDGDASFDDAFGDDTFGDDTPSANDTAEDDTDNGGGDPHPQFVLVADAIRPACAIPACHGESNFQGNFQIMGNSNATYDQIRASLEDVNTAAGLAIVTPGNPDSSELYKLLIHDNPSERMPPAPFLAFNEDIIETVRAWIAAGAPYE